MLSTKMTQKALEIAQTAHAGQIDKAGNPYIEHPLYLAEQMQDETSTIVALLHDTVEDSDYTLEDIKKLGFLKQILDALALLTHDEDMEYFAYIEEIKQNSVAIRVKLADLKHNSDLSRLHKITKKDLQRAEKYKKAIEILDSALLAENELSLIGE